MKRLVALLRATWWLIVLVAVAAVTLGLLIDPRLGAAIVIVTSPVFIYFALMRYDGTGRERPGR